MIEVNKITLRSDTDTKILIESTSCMEFVAIVLFTILHRRNHYQDNIYSFLRFLILLCRDEEKHPTCIILDLADRKGIAKFNA